MKNYWLFSRQEYGNTNDDSKESMDTPITVRSGYKNHWAETCCEPVDVKTRDVLTTT